LREILKMENEQSFKTEERKATQEFKAVEADKAREGQVILKKTAPGGKGGGAGGGKQLSASMAASLSEAKYASDSLNQVIKVLDDNKGSFGNVAGRWGELLGKVGGDSTDAGKKANQINAILRTRAQEIGSYLEGGKLAEGDIKRYLDMLPQITDGEETVRAKVRNLQDLIAAKQAAKVQAIKASGYRVGGIESPSTPGAPQIGGDKKAAPSAADLKAMQWASDPNNKSDPRLEGVKKMLKAKGLLQ